MGDGIFRRFAGWCGSAALAWLLTVNVAVWLLTAVVSLLPAGCPLTEATLERALALPSGFGDWAWRPWTLLSYMVTQFSLLHLLFNMLWLFWFGRLSLTLSDSRGLAVAYIGGGVAGGVMYLAVCALTATGGSHLCGSSAAVLAVMATAAVLTPHLRLRLMLIGEVSLKWLAVGCMLLCLAGSWGNWPTQMAHIGGAAFGALFGLACRRRPGLTAALAAKVGKGMRRARARRRDGRAVAEAGSRMQGDHARLDELLDKIRFSGYGSLTRGERNELELLSRRLRK